MKSEVAVGKRLGRQVEKPALPGRRQAPVRVTVIVGRTGEVALRETGAPEQRGDGYVAPPEGRNRLPRGEPCHRRQRIGSFVTHDAGARADLLARVSSRLAFEGKSLWNDTRKGVHSVGRVFPQRARHKPHLCVNSASRDASRQEQNKWSSGAKRVHPSCSW